MRSSMIASDPIMNIGWRLKFALIALNVFARVQSDVRWAICEFTVLGVGQESAGSGPSTGPSKSTTIPKSR